MTINHMRYFLAAVKHGNFRRAAEELNISQPVLSNSIKTLEEYLGAQLLERSNKTFPCSVICANFFVEP